MVEDPDEDVRVFEGREAQSFQRDVFEQGFFSEGGMSKLQWETGVYAKMLGECSEPSHPSNDFWTPVPPKPVPTREVA